MYHLYVKSKSTVLPRINFTYSKLSEAIETMNTLTVSLSGAYVIKLKDLPYDDVMQLIKDATKYQHLDIYIEVSDSVLKYVKYSYPDVSILGSESYWDIFIDLVRRYSILLEKGGLEFLYRVLPRDYDYINDFLLQLKDKFGDKQISIAEIKSNFVIDDLTYPRTVLIAYLTMSRWRASKLKKSINDFGQDLVLYAMRKNVRKLLEEKIMYYKTGTAPKYIKDIPYQNIVCMCNVLDYGRDGFKDIFLLLKLYERGVTVNDFIKRSSI